MADEKFHEEHEDEYVPEHDEANEDILEQEDAVHDDEVHPEHEEAHDTEPIALDEEADTDGVHSPSHDHEVEEPATESELAQHAAAPDEAATPPKNWYIVHAYSGFEQKVADSLRTRAQAFGFADRLGQILIPTEEVIELKNGKKVTSKRLLYPGYVLIEMEMDDDLWHAVKSTPRVTGFVGGGTKPVPLTADEVNSVLYRQASSAERPRPKMTFEKHETVKIIDGPFTNFSGKVDEVNSERNTLRVMVTIFGRSTPVELDFLQVEKA
ncbi:MAG TPA: transcription termination/antitermination protein NusG [Bryobacteraceae bacterium]|nr:transcription termination/antitermination protein NusG [Bryobacteraceae bacterium]